MKKITFAISSVLSFFIPKIAFAQALTPTPIPGSIGIVEPSQGYKTLGAFINNAVTLVFGIALLLTLIYLIWGAFDWITSGGDKEGVGKARSKIINALVGLVILGVAFALARTAGEFLGFDLLNIVIPKP